MQEPIAITAFKCPYCNFVVDRNKAAVYEHAKRCSKNPEYTQKCIDCSYLEKDYLLRSIDGKPLCIYSGECPYQHHDNTEVMQNITQSKSEYKDYLAVTGCSEDEIDKIMKEEWKG